MKRFAASAAVLVTVPLLAVSGSAGAAPTAVTLGELIGSTPAFTCGGGGTAIQGAVASGSPSYTVPASGVITSFSSQTNAVGGAQVRLALYGAPTGMVFPLKAKSPTFAMAPSSINTFQVQIPVQAGWLVGAQFTGANVWCGQQTTSTVNDLYFTNDSTDSPSVTTTNIFDFHVNVKAVFEPDVDGDGFGDVSQDLCPESKLSHAACPAPETTVSKKPAKHGTHRTAKIKFTSSIAGSTFTCAVDGKAAKPCTSPLKKKYKYGKHTVLITATSAVGIVDATPAKVKFKITAP